MIKDLLISFKENIKQKTSNPFLGTLIIVWLLHNYKHLYELFFSGSYLLFKEKLNSLELLFNPNYFLVNLLECIIISFIVLIITYFLLSLSRLISNIHEKVITPWVYKITDKSSIVLKMDFERLNLDKERVQKRFEQERETRIRLENEIEELENKIKKSLKSDSDEQTEPKPEKNENEKLVELLENKGYLETFESLIFSINNNEWVAEEEGHKFFITLGLITSAQKSSTSRIYQFTDRGKKFQDYYRINFLFTNPEKKE
jgi:hypothetical protein